GRFRRWPRWPGGWRRRRWVWWRRRRWPALLGQSPVDGFRFAAVLRGGETRPWHRTRRTTCFARPLGRRTFHDRENAFPLARRDLASARALANSSLDHGGAAAAHRSDGATSLQLHSVHVYRWHPKW